MKLPVITDEDREFLHYNPNTSDIVEWVQNYARRAISDAGHCECSACVTLHASDCSVHNEPAYPKGPCDCGVVTTPSNVEAQGPGGSSPGPAGATGSAAADHEAP